MEEEDTKLCTNCKREVPTVNFMTHSVHCARNLRNCPVCKEPVPVAQLQEHHDALHKEVPCKECGESVCGTDLEDHIRDSCAQTIKPCRYCELELPRRALPGHESYCGARSEQCADCGEYVMAKYKTLHLDSNHGFIRLDSDPVPKEAKPKPKPVPKPITNGIPAPSTSRNGTSPAGPATVIRRIEPPRSTDRPDGSRNGTTSKVTVKRTNDQPQINTNVQPAEKVNKQLPSRGAVKKRPAPPPPDPRRDLPYQSAARRQHDEETQRQLQTAYNLSVGLPPVLSAAAKLEKLRKMDALHNREVEDQDYKSRLQGRVWQPADVPAGQLLGRGRSQDLSHLQPMSPEQFMDRALLGRGRSQDLSHLQPMSEEQFMDRFQELQLGGARRGAGADRFSEIKSSLRELRRGLNEVTAPYNAASNASSTNQIDSGQLRPPSPPADDDDDGGGLRLPCEFCGAAVPADDLVLHQTGCRPDLTRYTPSPTCPTPPPPRAPRLDDIIPCEFCTRALPFYQITEHQERCGRDSDYCDRC